MNSSLFCHLPVASGSMTVSQGRELEGNPGCCSAPAVASQPKAGPLRGKKPPKNSSGWALSHLDWSSATIRHFCSHSAQGCLALCSDSLTSCYHPFEPFVGSCHLAIIHAAE